jgi:hypothetical protein
VRAVVGIAYAETREIQQSELDRLSAQASALP